MNHHKLSMVLPRQVFEQIRSLSEERGVTMTEAIKSAIATEKWRREVVARGGRIIIEDTEGNRMPVEFR